ncbi:hypothetical protein AHiyo8_58850 [Arthrobacter sp. Hiyo8]|uniref:WhiB family transcriptional regulator n=1 Tax=Arthrobacter sp. Hiyo1 TaxID=1588020 RepID=UPI0006839395|nr:WhiB family transcriptional regulator [Arthrobacter sp. Hiyo1]BAS17582.1 hypothetical protein AHiyo8_58850 [Arthrobacter sp. Hiyo8]GAP57941.1 hypothetical protein AHiyo1_09030 [Arthrobacter sp. Hiyo1]
MDLAPSVVSKYFDSDGHKQPFLSKTAKAICARCVIQPACLEAALNRTYPERGVVGGLTANEIRAVKEWEAYDKGLRETPPKRSRVTLVQPTPSPASEFAAEIREKQALSFEEQVYGVFLDVRRGKYQNLNLAIADIALIHSQAMEARV